MFQPYLAGIRARRAAKDPEGEQVRVLQAALRHMLDHTVAWAFLAPRAPEEKIEQDIPSEIMFGVQPGMMTSRSTQTIRLARLSR